MNNTNDPIGVFDSGIGGLTVVKQLKRLMPNENFVYFGDTARVPYGTRSEKLIKQYALEDTAFLQQFKIKFLVIACNTVSAVAIDLLKSALSIPVTGVIQPGVEAALKISKIRRIGVIGTTATIESSTYDRTIKQFDPLTEVFGQPCPLLVPLIEEGWVEEEVTRLIIRKYLQPVLENQIDTLILGCTHFPVIKDLIQEEAGNNIILIDSGKETAKMVKNNLIELNIYKQDINKGTFKFFVSDIPKRFDEIGTRFLGQPVVNAHRVDFDNFLMEQGDKVYYPLNLFPKRDKNKKD